MKFSKDRLSLHLINMFMQMIFVFFNVFFSIFIYDLSNNVNFVLCINLFAEVVKLAIELICLKLLFRKSFNWIYRSSFILALISIGLVFTITSRTLFMAYIVQFVYAITLIFFYCPHEVAGMNKTEPKHMKNFLGIQSLVGVLSSFLSPFLSGYIIDYISYYVLFAIVMALAAICFGISFYVRNAYIDTPKIKYTEFFVEAHKIKKVRYGYFAYGIFKFSQDTVYSTILTLLLFMKVGTNFSVGLYSALAAVFGGIVLLLYMRFVKKKALVMWLSTLGLTLISVMIVFYANIYVFFVYYFLRNAFNKILHNGTTEVFFNSINNTKYQAYKKEHRCTGSVYNGVFCIVANILALMIYNLKASVISLSVVLLVLTAAQFLSTWFIIKSNKLQQVEEITTV